MITELKQKENQAHIIDLLQSTKRPNIENLIQWLTDHSNFFTSPASTKYHGAYRGGLAQHSLNVLHYLEFMNNAFDRGLSRESMIIAALLHDVCKIGAYIGDSAKYAWNKSQPAGHAELSINRILEYITLTPSELCMIRHHMGPYCHSSEELKTAWDDFPEAKLMYMADELATLREQHQERRP